MAEKKDEKPKSVKIQLGHARRIREFGKSELRIYARGDIVEVERVTGLGMIAGGLGDGVEMDSKTSKGRGLDESLEKPKKPKGP